jgi:signal transduction histidine kinase
VSATRGNRRARRTTSRPAVAPVSEWTLRPSFMEAHPWLVDGLVAGIYAIPLIISRTIGLIQGDPYAPLWHLVVTVLTGVALLFRRYRPLSVLVAVSILTTLATWSLDAGTDILAVAIALYSVAAFRSRRLAWISAGGALIVAAVGLWMWSPMLSEARTNEYNVWNLLLIFVLSSCIGVLLGSLARGRRERLCALEERAQQLARERDNESTIATLAERSRIAREMHDIVAHSLSVMVALADGAVAAVDRDPAQSKQALEMVSETGRMALTDMRSVLSVLRETPEGGTPEHAIPEAPAPGQGQLAELVERFRAAGLPIRYSVTGVPQERPTHELALYRIVQEALTNALRYARGATRIDVTVDWAEDHTAVTIVDDGRPADGSRHSPASTREPSVGTGRGIIGMTERASMLGGTVEAGPLPNRGWRVHAELPTASESAAGGRP